MPDTATTALARIPFVLTALLVSAPVWAQSPSTRAGKAGDVRSLIVRAEAANDKCRGGSGDDQKTWAACERRDALVRRIDALGWCSGKTTDETAADSKWHRCGPDSLRVPAE